MLLRRAAQTSRVACLSRASSTAVVSANQESFAQKGWRWLDITGYLTKWHSRRAWILDLDPPSRAAAVMMTEYEYMNGRKRDFSFHGGRWMDCKECRWLEFECKKMCHDRLREQGREVLGGRRPRSQTFGFH